MSAEKPLHELIAEGYAVRPVVYAMQPNVISVNMHPNIQVAYSKYAANKSALCFCENVAHAGATAAMLCDWGVYSETYSYVMSRQDKADLWRRFEAGEVKVVCTVYIPDDTQLNYLSCIIFNHAMSDENVAYWSTESYTIQRKTVIIEQIETI